MKKVLLIEVDVESRENTRELLKVLNFSVITAADGKSALELVNTQLPDIIICDVLLPDIDGYTVLEIVSNEEKTKEIPFIFLSSKIEIGKKRRAMKVVSECHISKPFSKKDLVSAIDKLNNKSLNFNNKKPNIVVPHQIKSINGISLGNLREYFTERGEVFHFKKREDIYRYGHASNYIYFIKNGIVKCHRIDESGKELTIAIYTDDNLIGYTSMSKYIPYSETATSLGDSVLIGILKDDLISLFNDNHKLTMELIDLLTEDLRMIEDRMFNMAYSSVNKKTALAIIYLAEKLDSQHQNSFSLSRNDLASVVGISPETLIRTISKFKKYGLIDLKGKCIKILSLDKLKLIN